MDVGGRQQLRDRDWKICGFSRNDAGYLGNYLQGSGSTVITHKAVKQWSDTTSFNPLLLLIPLGKLSESLTGGERTGLLLGEPLLHRCRSNFLAKGPSPPVGSPKSAQWGSDTSRGACGGCI